ncbi:hypothetical protein L9F63_023146 [Diploptera punctata]|uniref:Major facilitator superfamily (MFS) profile domain-containing protein n=1 Tax=Diploptera punctata TaxID=6984 RepID=A0AAD8E9J5_DIPPU|nr:hypothetical protein L9F63_023146 [Diploptera punctata]
MFVQCPTILKAKGLQFLAAGSAALSFLIIGTFGVWPSPTHPKLKESMQTEVTSDEWAWVISVMGIGGVITPVPAAYFGNKLGRKVMLLACAPFFLVAWLLIIFASSATELLIARTIGGFGVGIVFSICPVYVAEIAEDKIRGILGTLMQLLMNIGTLVEFAVGPYVSYKTLGWVSGFFPLLFLVLMSFMPESPRYHCMKNKRDRAEASLLKLRGAKNCQDIKEELDQMQKVVEEEMTKKGRPRDLISTKGTRRALLLMLGLITVQQFGGNMAIMSNAQEIFRTSGGDALDPSISAIIMGIIQLVVSVVTSFLVDRLGRRILLLISTIGCATSLFTLGTYQYLTLKVGLDTSHWNWLPLFSLMMFLVSYCLGLGPLPIAYCGEIFSSNVRGLALSIASMMLSFSFIIVTKLYQVVADGAGVYVAFWFFGSISLAGTLFVYFLLLETKGKSLECIVAELNNTDKKLTNESIAVYTIQSIK